MLKLKVFDSDIDKQRKPVSYLLIYGRPGRFGVMRAKNLAVLIGTRKALAVAVKNQDTSHWQTFLKELLQ
jgi:hypothetical protein